MKKLLLLCSALLISACTVQVTEPSDEPETYCYLRKIYYNEACGRGEYATKENCDRWLAGACNNQIDADCAYYDNEFYFQVEECTEVYKK